MLDRRFKSRHLLTQRRACCPGLPRGPEQAPAPWSPPSAACAPRIIEFSGGCQKIEKIDLPPTMLDRRFKSRHLLTQRRACCPGLPRGPEQAPAPWSPRSAACAPRIIEFSGGCQKIEKIDLPPTMLDRRFKSRHLLTQRRACCPGLPRGPEQAPAPWSPRSAACAPRIIELSRGVLEIRENRPPPDDAGPALQEPASAYPEARMLPRAAPRPRAGACTLESSLRCLRTSDHRVLRGLSKNRENRPPPDDAGPALQEPASAYPETRMLPRAAPRPRAGACTLESSLRCLRTSDHRVLRGVLEIRENRLPPDDAGPALQEPASAYPETRMLPRAAPRPRAGACTLESSLRCLRTSDHRVLRWGVGNSRKSTSPRRCWTGASRAGICLPRDAHAAPGCPEAPSRRLHPGVLPPLPAHLGSSSSPGVVKKSRKSTSPRRCWTGASRAGICLPRDAHAAPGCPEAPSRRLHPGVLPPLPAHLRSSSSPVGCWKFEKIDLPPTMLDRRFKSRHLLTQRRACCPGLPRGPEQAPAPWSPRSAACAPPIIELSRGVLEIRENRPPPDDARPALQEPASAYPETRMLPRAAPRPRAGACTLESSLRCLRTSNHPALPWGVGNSRKSTSPRRCWTGASRAGICLPRDAHAAPGCPEAPSRRLHPGVLPPLPAHLGSSSSPGVVKNSRKSTSPRRCWTGASRAGICLPRGAHAAPGCPEAPSRRLHPGVLPPLPAHLGSSSSPGGVENSRKSTSPRRC
jgi:hypothetical protein